MKSKFISLMVTILMIVTMTGCGEAKYVVQPPDGKTHEVSEDEAKELKEFQDELKDALGMSDETDAYEETDEEDAVEAEESEETDDVQEEKYIKFEEIMGKNLERGLEEFGIIFSIYENGAAIDNIKDEYATIPETVKGSDGKEYPVVAFGTGGRVFEWYKSENKGPYELPKNIKYVADDAFSNAIHITELIIPDTVEFIGGHKTFYEMRYMEKIVLPKSVKTDGKWDETFYNCFVLRNVDIPSGVYEMRMTFEDCESLESYSLPDGLLEIGEFTFNGCVNLNDIKVPDSVEIIGNGVFNETNITSFEYPKNLKKLDYRTFEGCESLVELRVPKIDELYGDLDSMQAGESLEAIIFDDGLNCEDVGTETRFGTDYYNCPNLKTVVCPDGVKDIVNLDTFPEGQLTVYVESNAADYFQSKFPNVTFKAK